MAAHHVSQSRRRLSGLWRGCVHHAPYYVADGAGWVIDSEGAHIARELKSQSGLDCHLIRDTGELPFLRRQVIHFGSQWLYTGGGSHLVHPSNRIAVTWFHGDATDPSFAPAVAAFQQKIGRVDRVIVSCSLMRRRIATWNIPDDKVILIPIGVDLAMFYPPTPGQREAMRARLGIRPGHVVIGSFQKDGVGWGEGLEPKLIKGPDIFLQVLDCLRTQIPLFVLLTGPARGYVCRGLERMEIPYRHVLLKDDAELAPYYHALDLYLVTSREEGGPKAVMESMATGVPLVSTQVGMAIDLIDDGTSGFLCPVEDVDGLAARAMQVITNDRLRERFKANGYQAVRGCSFKEVARLHFELVYSPLLAMLSR